MSTSRTRQGMEAEDEETLDLPMMSNRDISLVDHYILDLSCYMKSKSFTGSITLFMQPAPKSKALHLENKTCHVTSSPDLSTQCATKSQAVPSQTKKISPSEQTSFLVSSKMDDTTDFDPKVGIINQQTCNLETDVCYVSNKESSTTRKDIQNLSVNLLNENIPVLPMGDQKTDEFVPPKDNFKIDPHSQSPQVSCVAQSEFNVGINSLLIKEVIPISSTSHSQIDIPSMNPDHTRESPSTPELIPGITGQEETSDKFRNFDVKRKTSECQECPVNSKQSKLIENAFLSNETCGTKDRLGPAGDQTVEIPDPSNPKPEFSASSSAQTSLSLNDQPFVLILDACDICVFKVKLLELPNCDVCAKPCLNCPNKSMTGLEREKFLRFCSLQPGRDLRFSTTKWSLNIWDEPQQQQQQQQGQFDANFPFVVRIEYSTLLEGKSFKWVTDQDGNMAAFTRGDFINNRSLFPSQDHPETMSTWQAYITVDEPNIVLMTGDKEAVVTPQNNGKR